VSKILKKLLAIPVAALILLISASSVKAQTTFNVNSTIDAVDVNPGNGICETALGNGICTLRAAIQEANVLPGSDVVQLPAGDYVLTIPGQNENLSAAGDLDVLHGLNIIGMGAEVTKISGGGDRVISILSGAEDVELKGLTISGGVTPNTGAGIYQTSWGLLKITDSVVSYNTVTGNLLGPSEGGGVYGWKMEIVGSKIVENRVQSQKWASGAGIYSWGPLTMEQSTVAGNHIQSPSSVDGGGILSRGGFSINNSTIESNDARNGYGGGISQWTNSSGTISNSFIGRNNAGTGGGIASRGNLSITNTTFSSNQANTFTGSSGGAIYYSSSSYIESHLNITNSTLNDNYATGTGGSIYTYTPSLINIVNSILSARTPNNCGQPIHSLGHNLSADATCGFTNVGDLQNTYPYLGPLQDNGGPTLSHSLLQNSPAIDSGDPTNCPSTDQRGVIRPQGLRCDIGAFEAEPFNQPPTASSGPDQTVDEGQPVTFDGSGSTDPDGVGDIVSYAWNFGDGVTANGQTANHTYIDNGVYTVTLTVTDTQGESDADTAIITVNNVSPTASFSVSSQTIIRGQSATLSFSNQYDPSSVDTQAGFIYSYDCTNDGTFELTDSSSTSFVCSYPNSGVYTVNGRIKDKDGGYTDYSVALTVQTPSQTINDLVNLVETYNLQQGISNSLDAKLGAALNALGDITENNDQAAINSLQAFINAVDAQRGDKITSVQADILITMAQAIITSL